MEDETEEEDVVRRSISYKFLLVRFCGGLGPPRLQPWYAQNPIAPPGMMQQPLFPVPSYLKSYFLLLELWLEIIIEEALEGAKAGLLEIVFKTWSTMQFKAIEEDDAGVYEATVLCNSDDGHRALIKLIRSSRTPGGMYK
ncbi:hypothetical protein Tco_0312329 [Tanacetum coccineum]